MTAASRLRLYVAAGRSVLLAETLAAELWPAASLCAAVAALALFGLPSLLPWGVHLVLLLSAAVALACMLVRTAARTRLPAAADAERRLERDSGLPHRPFATLRDRPAVPDGAPPAFWLLHQARARAALASLRLAPPRPHLPRRDPYALRGAASVLLAAGLVVAGPRAGARLQAALLPGLPGLQGGEPAMVQAWIQPPAYTGLPPVFLPQGGSAADAPITVPAGSRLTLSITGLSSAPSLTLAGRRLGVEALGHDSFQATASVTEGGRLTIGRAFSTLAGWSLAVLPNEPPAIAWTAPPGRAGTSLSTRLPWQVRQRWGVARLQAELRPRGRPDLPALVVPLPLPGTPRDAKGSAAPDLSAEPYAGLMLTGRLTAEDVSGQRGQGAPADFVLPAREFRHPLARAIAELRRRLALHPDQRLELADEVSSLAEAPLAQPTPGLTGAGIALNLSAGAALLASPRAHAADIAAVQARLWTLALALDGALPDASARALAQAREDLRHGIEDHARGKLSDRELNQKLDALRQALDKRLADLGKRAAEQGALQKFDPKSQHLSAPSIDRMIDRLERSLQDGKMAEARQQMAELERMMDQLKNAHIMTQEEMREQQKQARTGRQQMGAVQDMVQRESGLLDHAQARGADSPAIPQGASPLDQFGQPPGPDEASPEPPLAMPPSAPPARRAPDPAQDARTQRALHRALDALKDGLAQSGRQKPHSLDDASQAMQDAAGALSAAHEAEARDAIARAIAALQQGGQEMSRQQGQGSGTGMQLSLSPGGRRGDGQGEDGQGEDGQEEPGDGHGGQRRDPFGRPVDGSGTMADDPGLRVPDRMEEARSRAIQEELRRRGADRGRPKGELDYIGRLLKPF